MTNKHSSAGPAVDEALAAEARGVGPTSDDAEAVEVDGEGEVDAIATAAGVHQGREKPLSVTADVEQRDAHRWELDPASAEDAKDRTP